MTHFSFYDHHATQSECAHRLIIIIKSLLLYYCNCLCYFSIIIYIVIILITVCTVVIRKHLALNFLSITTEIFSFLVE